MSSIGSLWCLSVMAGVALCGCSVDEGDAAAPGPDVRTNPTEPPADAAPAKVTPKENLPEEPGDDDTLAALEALGYVDRTETSNPQERGVTKSTRAAFDGLNLLSSRHRATAELIDNQGRVLHTWTAESQKPPWMHVELQPNGDIVVLAKDRYMARFDWNSKLLWKRVMRAHHDFTFDPAGRLVVLHRRVSTIEHSGTKIPILEDRIAVLSDSGEIERDTSLFPLIKKYVPRARLRSIKKKIDAGTPAKDLARPEGTADITHTNSVIVLDRPLDGVAPQGAVLISMRELDRILILSPDLSRVVWSWGKGEIDGQHHATLLDNDNILLFDNGVGDRKSRVLEVNPSSGEIAWSFTTAGFFTRLRGAAQALPNGNVLATVSDSGHAVEVNRSGEIVWEFWNPDVVERTDGKKPTRAVIYRLLRYGRKFLSADQLETSLALSPPSPGAAVENESP